MESTRSAEESLKIQLQDLETKIASSDASLSQAVRENEDLKSLCEELMQIVESGQHETTLTS